MAYTVLGYENNQKNRKERGAERTTVATTDPSAQHRHLRMLVSKGTTAAIGGSKQDRDSDRCAAESKVGLSLQSLVLGNKGERTSAYPEFAFWKNNLTYGSALGLKKMPSASTAIANKARGFVTA